MSDDALALSVCANPYDIIRLSGFEFGIRHPESACRDALLASFPRQHAPIAGWFAACEAARASAFTLFALHSMPAWMCWRLRLWRCAEAERWARQTAADELSKIKDPLLSAVLGARWADDGAPPQQAPLVVHALVAAAGAGTANQRIYESEDIGVVWRRPADEDAPGLFVAFPSLKDPSSAGKPTAELVVVVDASAFAPWLALADDQRPEACKAWVEERMLAHFLRHFPAMRPMARFHELSAPVTQHRYVRSPEGAM